MAGSFLYCYYYNGTTLTNKPTNKYNVTIYNGVKQLNHPPKIQLCEPSTSKGFMRLAINTSDTCIL